MAVRKIAHDESATTKRNLAAAVRAHALQRLHADSAVLLQGRRRSLSLHGRRDEHRIPRRQRAAASTTSRDAQAPLTLANARDFEMWDLSLEEVVRLTLENSTVIRNLGGRDQRRRPEHLDDRPRSAHRRRRQRDHHLRRRPDRKRLRRQHRQPVQRHAASKRPSRNSTRSSTPSLIWQKNDRPQNFGLAAAPDFFNPLFRQDTGRFTRPA